MRRAFLYAQQVCALALMGGGVLAALDELQRVQRWGIRGPVDAIELALIGVGLPLAGLVWSFFVQRGLTEERASREERAVLDFAIRNGGVASALTASVATGLPVKRTDKILRELQRLGHAEMDVGSSGGIVYRFPSLVPTTDPAENQARAITRPGIAVAEPIDAAPVHDPLRAPPKVKG